jgi:hypothetical protein
MCHDIPSQVVKEGVAVFPEIDATHVNAPGYSNAESQQQNWEQQQSSLLRWLELGCLY